MKHFGKLLKHICRFLCFQQPATVIGGVVKYRLTTRRQNALESREKLTKCDQWDGALYARATGALIYSTFRAHRANWIMQSGQMWALCVWVIGLSCFSKIVSAQSFNFEVSSLQTHTQCFAHRESTFFDVRCHLVAIICLTSKGRKSSGSLVSAIWVINDFSALRVWLVEPFV